MGATSNSKASVNFYDAKHGNFHSELYGEIRRQAFGEKEQLSWPANVS